ncbi:MAG: LacI family DNA-binding transcriptional regulator, partial [Candidatus Puniceispirillaceae bacterium]
MMATRSVPTLDDVAKRAAVSTATVSRCLNSPEQVSESTRNRVNEAVMALGYTPNFGARVMAAKRTNTIGAIIPTMENAIFARGLQAFQDELRTKGYTLLVASSSYKSDVEEEQVRALIARGADGLLLIGHDRSTTILNYLAARNVPALVAWAHDPDAVLPSIGFDNFEAMCALARRVISLGHKRIGLISAATESNDRARARVLAVRYVMEEA